MATDSRITFGNARLGGTSWVMEGSFADNLRRLSCRVSDMEIVLFDLPGASNLPTAAEVLELRRLCLELKMSCTVHFPTELNAKGTNQELEDSAEDCLRIIRRFAPLQPFSWILHVTGFVVGDEELSGWLVKAERGLEQIVLALPDKERLCVENTDFNLSPLQSVIARTGISICLDIGHLINLRMPVLEYVENFFDRTKVVHLHGVKPDGTDHADLSFMDRVLLKEIIESYGHDANERVLALEVFEQDYDRSVKVLDAVMKGSLVG